MRRGGSGGSGDEAGVATGGGRTTGSAVVGCHRSGRHVVVGWSGNPVMQRPLTEQDFFAYGHVAVRISGRDTFIESALRKYGERRRIEVTAPSFIQAPWLLPGTQRLALMHERLAKLVAPCLSLTIAEPPIEWPVMREMMQYHTARSNDAALAWLRQQLNIVASYATA